MRGLFSVTCKHLSYLRGIAIVILISLLLAVTYLVAATPATASAATNPTLNFQARLESSSGAIAPDGTYNVTFHLYNATTTSSGSTTDTACGTDPNCLWEESYTYNSGAGSTDARIKVANGYLTANLGSITAFPTTISWGQPLYLTMDIGGTVGSGTITWDGQMNPRLPLTAVPSAFALTSTVNSGGYNSTLSLVQPASGVTGNEIFQVPDQGAAGTYNLLTNGNVSGATAGVALQSGTPPGTVQTGNFNVSGTGLLGTLDATGSGSANTLTIGAAATYTGTINIETNASVTTGKVTIGGANQTGTITIGQTSGGSNTINIGAATGNTYTQTINIGTSSTTGSTTAVTVGSTIGSSSTTVQGGTGGLWLETGNAPTGNSGNLVIQSGNSTSGTAGNVSIDAGVGAVSTGSTLENDTFESGTNGWSAWFSSSVAQSSTYAHTGTYSLAITDTTVGGSNWGAENYTVANTVTPGQVYSFTAWVRSSVVEQIYLQANWNGGGTTSTIGVVTDTTTGWTKISGYATAPAGATSVYLDVGSSVSYAQNTVAYLDDVTIAGSSSAPVVSVGATNAASVILGNTAEAGSTTIQGGSSGVNVISSSTSTISLQSGSTSETIANSGDTITTSTNSVSAFQIQNAAGSSVVTANTTNGGSLTASNSPNAISYVQEKDGHGTASTTSTSITLASTPTVGDLMLLAVKINSASAAHVITVNGGGVNYWKLVNTISSTTGNNIHVELWEGIVKNASTTVTATYNTTPGVLYEMVANEFTASGGTGTSWSVIGTNTADNSPASTTVTYPSITSTVASQLYWGYMETTGTPSLGSTPGFSYYLTTSGSGGNNEAAYDTNLAASTPYTPTATQTSALSTGVATIVQDNVTTTLTVSGASTLNGTLTINSDNIPLILNVANSYDENGIYFNSSGPFSGNAGAELGVAGAAGEVTSDSNANDLVLKNGTVGGYLRFETGGSLTSQFILTNTGAAKFQNSTNSATAFQINNTGGNSILTADSTNNKVVLGTASNLNGQLTFNDSSDANTTSLIAGSGGSLNTSVTGNGTGSFGYDGNSGGYSNDGNNNANNMVCSQYLFGSRINATTTSITTYTDAAPGSGFTYSLAIYAGNNNQPTTLVASASGTLSTTIGANTLPLSTTLTANTPYWLCENTNDTAGVWAHNFYNTDSSWAAGQTYGTWPATITNPSGAYYQKTFVIKVNYSLSTAAPSTVQTTSNTGQDTLQSIQNNVSALSVQDSNSNNVFSVSTGGVISGSGVSSAGAYLGNGFLYLTGMPNPTGITETVTASGGSYSAGHYVCYSVDAIDGQNDHTEAIFGTAQNDNADTPADCWIDIAANNSEVTIAWNAVTGATGYTVYMSTDGNNFYSYTVGSGVTSVVDTGLTSGIFATQYSGSITANPTLYHNGTTGINMQSGARITLDGGTGGGNAGIVYDNNNSNLSLFNENVGGKLIVQANTFKFQDTNVYNDDLTIDSAGEMYLQGNTLSTSAFQVLQPQSAGGNAIFTVNTSSSRVVVGGDLSVSGALRLNNLSDVLSGTPGWFKLGVITLPQGGYNAEVKIYGGAGYNAQQNQNGYVDLMIRTSNGSSVDANGFAATSYAESHGQGYGFISAIDLVSNAAGTAATSYTVYADEPTSGWLGQGFYSVDTSGGSWTSSVATATNPGAGSSTVEDVPFQEYVNNQFIVQNSSGTAMFNVSTSGNTINLGSSTTTVLSGMISAYNPASPTTAEVWHTISLASGWSTVAGQPTPSYRLLPDGTVEITGTATRTSFSTVTVLDSTAIPTSYRPTSNEQFVSGGAPGDASLEITTGGILNCEPPTTGTTYCRFDGVYPLNL